MPSPVTREQVWVNVSPAYKCWRLVYNSTSKRVFIVFEKEGLTKTMQSLFCSTRTDAGPGAIPSAEGKKECLNKVRELGLKVPEKAVQDDF
jgi:hypothetical protein